jgi:hypothetical protein
MKKWMFAKAAFFFLFLAAILLMLFPMPEQRRIELIGQELEKGLQICEEIKENNFLIKRYIFATAILTTDQDKNRIRLGELMASVEKAEKLITESEIELAGVSQSTAFEKLDKAKKKLKEANKLHKKVLNGLSAILSPQPLMPTIEI